MQQVEFREYRYRWVILFLFALPSFVNGMCWVVVSPIVQAVIQNYSETSLKVISIPLSYMVTYIFINFPSNWILDTKGLRKGLIIGAVMTALGAGIRCLLNLSFNFAVVGQVFCAIGQPFILNAPAKIATFWFSEKNRPFATAILSVINIIGTGAGFVLPSIIVDTSADRDVIRRQCFILMLVEFILASVGALLTVFLFRDKPPTPPSLGAKSMAVKTIFRNKNFLLLLWAFSTINGTFNFFGSLLNVVLDTFGYSDVAFTSILGALLIGIGLVGSIILSLYVQKTFKYKLVFIICAVVSLAAMSAFCFALYYSNQYWLLVITVSIMGFCLIPLIPLSFDFGCEIVFPIGEALVTGLLMTGGQILGILEIILLQQVYGLEERKHCFFAGLIVTGLLAAGLLGYIPVKQELRRKNEEINLEKGSLLSTK